jgi:hypothetical protein
MRNRAGLLVLASAAIVMPAWLFALVWGFYRAIAYALQ